MRHSPAAKMEVIRLVASSALSVQKTFSELEVPIDPLTGPIGTAVFRPDDINAGDTL